MFGAAGLEVLVGEVDREGLEACVDYILFPLLIASDSIAATRQPSSQTPADREPALPALKSDRTAELALSCLEALLRRCPGAAGAQTVALLNRFSAVVMLPASSTSEEVSLQLVLI